MSQQPMDHPQPDTQDSVPPGAEPLGVPPKRWVKPTFQQVPLNHALAGVSEADMTDGIAGYAS